MLGRRLALAPFLEGLGQEGEQLFVVQHSLGHKGADDSRCSAGCRIEQAGDAILPVDFFQRIGPLLPDPRLALFIVNFL